MYSLTFCEGRIGRHKKKLKVQSEERLIELLAGEKKSEHVFLEKKKRLLNES